MKRFVLEITPAEGGEDSKLLANLLATAYQTYLAKHGWLLQRLDKPNSEVHLELQIPSADKQLIKNFKQECGGHRFQRVPPTERKGRVHTSTVTVAFIEQNEHKELSLDSSQYEIQWYSGQGAGGQHRNKHQNSCRLIHRESGITVTAQCRSRQDSFNQAKAQLIKVLSQNQSFANVQEQASLRRNMVGSGMRADKIRTYRLQDDLLIDHVRDKKAKASPFLKGNISLIW